MAHGITWMTTVDAFLDEINRRDIDRQTALDSLARFIVAHPECESDTDLSLARISLLR